MKEKTAQKILNELQNNYNRIAEKFSETRNRIWPFLYELKDFVKDGDRILDVGCGNGRLLEVLKEKKIKYLGIDFSSKLIKMAQKRYSFPWAFFKTADFLTFEENQKFDVIFMIAFWHHIPSKKLRQKVLAKAKNLLADNGILIVSVWNLWNKKYFKYILKGIFDKIFRRKDLDFFDTFIPWENQFYRYYHAFLFPEAKRELKKVGFKIIKAGKTKGKQSNFYFICQKKSN